MSFVISSVLPFPNIEWWCRMMAADAMHFDIAEHFEKMTYRNRYYIAGANGLLKMSIPISGGREHRAPMQETGIDNKSLWQKQHWRTIVSAYNNAPYFEFYKDSLEKLFTDNFERLFDFNLSTVHWLKQQLDLKFEETLLDTYHPKYPEAKGDLRAMKPGRESCNDCDFPIYYQVFEERTGFLPNLSLLDLLFAEGPFTARWLRENTEAIMVWSKEKI
jgi:hypothetical protein